LRIAILPARGGSVRIPRKNILPFAGKPMLQWPVEAAGASGLFAHIVVSTDDDEIAALAEKLGCLVHRRRLDSGEMGTQELAARVLAKYVQLHGDVDQACVIYPCSPMLRARDLQLSHGQLTPRVQWVVSWLEDEDVDAGCFYWGRAWSFEQRTPLTERPARYVADPRRFIDINTWDDLARAESMFHALHP
jgi:CMP-N-acetylneuraminic acid synthetase